MSGAWSFILCYILWGLLPIFWKQLQMLSPLYILMMRIVFSMVFCYIILWWKGERGEIIQVLRNPQVMKRLAVSSILVTINLGLYILAVNTGYIVDVSLAYYLNPIFTIMTGVLLFREPVAKIQWIATAIAVIGVGISVFVYGKIPYFAMVIGISFALYGASKKDLPVSIEMAVFIETLLWTPLAIIYIIYAEMSGNGALEILSGTQYLLLPLTGIMTSVPLLLYAHGVRTGSMTLGGILMYIDPTVQLLVGLLLYDETFTKANVMTFTFVWVAVLLFISHNIKKLINERKEKSNET